MPTAPLPSIPVIPKTDTAEDTETEPHDGTQIDNGGQDAEHNPEHPDTGHLFLHVKGNALEIYILTFFHALLE